MTACNYLSFLAFGLVVIGWSAQLRAAQTAPVSGAPAPAATSSTTVGSVATTAGKSGHKTSRHRKKTSSVAVNSTAKTSTVSRAHKKSRSAKSNVASESHSNSASPGAVSSNSINSPLVPPVATSQALAPARPDTGDQTVITIPLPTAPATGSGSATPVVDTGLPVARPGSRTSSAVDPVLGDPLAHSRNSYQVASTFPPIPITSTLGSFVPHSHLKDPLDFTFTNFERRPRNFYPWKIDIVTTIFWIGEGSTPISSTTNEASAWDQDWRHSNGGSDSPDDRDRRNDYLPGGHIATVNPFYVALPFNDLAFPDKARRWVPASWFRPSRDGKQVSACQHRWLEIKNQQGDYCFAQWEDVGPLRYDHAEYVFGHDAPDTYTSGGLDHAGLDVSPAVAKYLNINGRNCITRWRFVDDADVQPGIWLKYDEEALLFKAIKNGPSRLLPIDTARAPIDDQSDIDANKKKIGAAKG